MIIGKNPLASSSNKKIYRTSSEIAKIKNLRILDGQETRETRVNSFLRDVI